MHWTTAAPALTLLGTAAALQIASLGSSFAAGPGIPSRANYAHHLSALLNATLADLSVSGSTLLTLPSQISRIPPSTDLVTVTSGGNDLGYVAGLSADSARGVLKSSGGRGTPLSAQPGLISEATLVARWDSALARIHARAPRARVYLVEYLTLLGPHARPGTPDVPFSASRMEHHRRVAAVLRNATARAAEGKPWVVDVPVARRSEEHGVGSGERQAWVNGARKGAGGGVAWHPNTEGMRAVAEMVLVLGVKKAG